MSQAQQASVVLLDWNELQGEKDFKEEIHRAYGVDGLGILCVKNVPGLAEARYVHSTYFQLSSLN